MMALFINMGVSSIRSYEIMKHVILTYLSQLTYHPVGVAHVLRLFQQNDVVVHSLRIVCDIINLDLTVVHTSSSGRNIESQLLNKSTLTVILTGNKDKKDKN